MGQVIDTEAYNEMISALSDFITKVSDACDEMEAAGNDCVANMQDDVASTKSNEKLGKCIAAFRETLETAQAVIAAMEQQVDDAIATESALADLD